MTDRKVVVVGGGGAGLMAAGQAALAGAESLVLEKMPLPGRKICITGKGRCNITNIAEINDFIGHFGKNGKFLRQAFHHFFNDELIEFFETNGLKLVKERGGRVFPASGKAPDVLDAILRWLRKCDATIERSSPVDKLLLDEDRIRGVIVAGKTIHCDAVIIATGGASYPATGSTGDGYRLAASAAHKIVTVRPALVPLVTSDNITGKMAGLTLRNIKVRMLVNGRKRRELFGELAFSKPGLTGPVILTLSGEAVDIMASGDRVVFSIDLKPALDEKKLDARLQREIQKRGKESFDSLLRGLLPREMVPVCLELTGIPAEHKVHNISADERRRLRNWLKDFRLEVTGHRPFSEAIVTAGGVDTREVDPRTMQSRLITGLFFAGEVLDIQGDTGGYNLQAAFSTGWLAGRSAANPDIS
jgi:predicted Rossmann fold flavoprotein